MDVLGEVELFAPVHNLAVGLVGVLAAEGWVSNKAFKHDRPQGPPVALLAITLLQKDLWRNVIRGTDRRVGLSSVNDQQVSELHKRINM